ncbi:LytTR family DNA-binding domain-containing protein [Lactobacillus sp. ESL0731]|uniref:LytTR family DNA-binding domain-containing protein n=1 Tax=unclassified Lactobacillus TaxID=2620435 RepID=UPI0023F7A82F|nr:MULTISPECIES: LytTR family DNA-binding domain-containing protein [unclassified Lactobacillus]WEV51298.1 LytTR family DNA-binding domain-containing protein [Lactobacillus sp. ESL0700]WEV62428.1 LytTR family DNA-binding domain-containing protein [Lactobacillus sp. ESL0731]
MLVKFNLNPKFQPTWIAINTTEKTAKSERMADAIAHLVNDWQIQGTAAGKIKMISLYEITRFYTQNKHVVCEVGQQVYRIKSRIYELSERLPPDTFIQISSSEIVSIASIDSLALTKTGSYQVNLTNGETTFTSRRYMQKLRKEFLK